MAKLFVGNLPFSVNEEELRRIFGRAGSVTSARVITDRDSGRSKGYGFVEMGTSEEAEAAIQMLQGTDVDGRPIKVDLAREREDDGGRGGRGGGGGYRGGGGGGGGGYRGGGGGGGGRHGGGGGGGGGGRRW